MSKLELIQEEKVALKHIDSAKVKDLYLDLLRFSRRLNNLNYNQHNFPAGKKHLTYHDNESKYVFAFIILSSKRKCTTWEDNLGGYGKEIQSTENR